MDQGHPEKAFSGPYRQRQPLCMGDSGPQKTWIPPERYARHKSSGRTSRIMHRCASFTAIDGGYLNRWNHPHRGKVWRQNVHDSSSSDYVTNDINQRSLLWHKWLFFSFIKYKTKNNHECVFKSYSMGTLINKCATLYIITILYYQL